MNAVGSFYGEGLGGCQYLLALRIGTGLFANSLPGYACGYLAGTWASLSPPPGKVTEGIPGQSYRCYPCRSFTLGFAHCEIIIRGTR